MPKTLHAHQWWRLHFKKERRHNMNFKAKRKACLETKLTGRHCDAQLNQALSV
jgi:hypothetical protein